MSAIWAVKVCYAAASHTEARHSLLCTGYMVREQKLPVVLPMTDSDEMFILDVCSTTHGVSSVTLSCIWTVPVTLNGSCSCTLRLRL